ncbi:MAG: GGDEF domain-containing protein [Eubacteriales bacterium]|nr:GGDEF domain-containing protein [Eubacteriales bacterium]
MKKHNYSLQSDLSFLALLLLILVGIVFTGNGGDKWEIHVLMYCAASVSMLITYFVSVTAGLITDMLILFAYVSYVLWGVIRSGETVDSQLYFWIIWIPLVTTALYFFCRSHTRLQEENNELLEQLERFSVVDEETNLPNINNFEEECAVYMRISKRYDMHMMLLVWELRYEDEVRKLLGKKRFSQQIKVISEVAQKNLRTEDSVFLLRSSPYLWGTIMFTNAEGERIVKKRLRDKLEEEQRKMADKGYRIDVRFGSTAFEDEKQTPLELLEAAKKRLAYDVPGGGQKL